MRTIGTVVRGVRAPIIREGDNIAEVAAASVMEAWKEAGIEPRDRDVVAVTESVVARAQGNYATLDQIAAAALYSVGPEYFEQVRQEYKRRRDTVVRKLHEIPGVICECPRGAFYLMAALPVDNAEKFQLWLLQEFEDHGDTVMFSAGEPFYATPGKGLNEVRMAYTINAEDISRAIDILAVAIKAYNEKYGK